MVRRTTGTARAASPRFAGWKARRPPRSAGRASEPASRVNPNVKIVASQNADWLREKALPVAQAMLQANPNVDVVFSHNDPMAAAAILAATNAHKDLSKMLFVGIDGLPTPDGGIKSVQAGRLGVTYVYPTGGAQAIDAAVQILEKKQNAAEERRPADRPGDPGQCRADAGEVRRQIVKAVTLTAALLLPCLCATAVPAQTPAAPVTACTLLRQESDLSQLPTLRPWTSTLQSSYDRTGGNDDSGKFLSGDGKDGIMADMDGPGAVVRLWSANPGGEIKIFIDNAPTPVIDTAFSHLFDGSFAPFKAPLCGPSSGGVYSYLPIPYARHCRIELIGGQGVYYHVNYLTFPKNTPATSFSLPLSASDQASVDAANAVWAGVAAPKPITLPEAADSQIVADGQTRTLANLKGPGVIRRLSLALPKASDADLRRLVLRGYFDGHKTPDVEAPVADFFGNAFGRKPFRTLLLGQAADGSFEADFPMPFARSARFTLENGSGAAQTVVWSPDIVKQRL